NPRTVEVNFSLKTGASFTFSEIKGNSEKLESIIKTYLIHNISHE
ncbi:MAG: hypothetical protein GYA23_01975, partial [Methanomicrobiales archaeon]|nr:hypothetical protein [Methanomicrobiales archaeon]